MSDEAHSIPDDMAARVARLINAAEDMRQQASDDLKQIYADLREELKGLGWQGSAVSYEVAALKGAIAEMRLDDKAKTKREERGERIDDYVSVLTRARAPARGKIEEFDTNQPETANEVPAQDGGGTGLGESLSGKSNAARPASVDAQPNGRGSAGQTEESVVTVVGTESGTVANSPIAPASHVEAEAPTGPTSGPTEGGRPYDGVTELNPNPHQAGPSSFSAERPAAYNLRPDCRNPGPTCAGHGSTLCHGCKVAMREREEA